MVAPYITHITLTTGHSNRSSRAEVGDDAVRLVAPWLAAAISTAHRSPLPVAALSHYSAVALVDGGGLIVTVYGPQGPHAPGQPHLDDTDLPLVTFAVAQRSRQGTDLWATLVAHLGATPGLHKPSEPWCAVALHPALAAYKESAHWLGDFERCVAWAWITRRPALEAVNQTPH